MAEIASQITTFLLPATAQLALAQEKNLGHNFLPKMAQKIKPAQVQGGRDIRPFIIDRGRDSLHFHSLYQWLMPIFNKLP